MAIDKKLQIFDDEGNPVDYDILASDVKFNDGKDLPTKLDEMEDEIGEGGYTPPQGGIPKTDLAQSVQDTLDDVANKVDKVTGKGLSTNDYTTEEKTKLAGLPTNPVQSISVNGQTQQKDTNGNVNIEVQAGDKVSVIQPANPDGTFIIRVGSTDYTVNLNHTHPNMAKLVVCKESDLPSTLDPATIYAQVDDADTPTEIQSLWIAGLEFVGGGGAADDTPKLTSPRNGGTIYFDGQSTATLVVKGKNLLSNLSLTVTGDFTVTVNGSTVSTISANDANNGVTLTLTKGSNFTSGSIEISSSEIDTARVSVKDSGLFDVLNGVKFTGSQWVNTGIGVGPNTSLKLDIEFINTFGASTSDGTFVSTSNAGFAFNITTGESLTDIYFWIQGQNVPKTYGNALYARGVIDYSPGQISFLGQSDTTATKTTTSENLAIGYGWNKSQPIYNEQHFIVYGLKIYQNSVLTNDFIPANKQGVAGLYDTINGVFISSETSTELVAVE